MKSPDLRCNAFEGAGAGQSRQNPGEAICNGVATAQRGRCAQAVDTKTEAK